MSQADAVVLPMANGAAKTAPKARAKRVAKPTAVRKATAAKPVAARKTAGATKPATVKKTVAAKKPAVVKKPIAAKKVVSAKPVAKKAVAKVARPTKAKTITKTTAKVAPKVMAKEVAVSKDKPKKAKLVRDSFSMPEAEYAVLGAVKKACLKAGVEVKKSELLRIGVALIQKMDVPALKGVLATLPPLKAGRPKQEK
ncbi:MAG TPA: hypothetical protein VNW52_04180 [Burkholderiaceae bacterium]|jgi:hypothetical protein|nr:hypothetical protein [Burkholderiaceae bacterium]